MILDASDGDVAHTRNQSDTDDDLINDNVTEVDPSETTENLIARARVTGNLSRRGAPGPEVPTHSGTLLSSTADKPTRKRTRAPVELTTETEQPALRAKLINSVKFPIADRPEWLQDDDLINALTPFEAAQIIAQAKMTKAMERQNELKESKANKLKGGLRVDQEVKAVKVTEGEDNASTMLHKQRFLFRTPILKPESYWEFYPVKWPEVTKRVHLEHLGLNHILSAKTIEMVHDRSDTSITIKMFSNVNVMIGKEGSTKTSRVEQVGNSIEVESRD